MTTIVKSLFQGLLDNPSQFKYVKIKPLAFFKDECYVDVDDYIAYADFQSYIPQKALVFCDMITVSLIQCDDCYGHNLSGTDPDIHWPEWAMTEIPYEKGLEFEFFKSLMLIGIKLSRGTALDIEWYEALNAMDEFALTIKNLPAPNRDSK